MGGDVMVTQSKAKPALSILNLNRGGWLIQSVAIEKWGTEVAFQATFDPDLPDSSQFKLVFSNCESLTWDAEENEFDDRDLEADVIGFNIYDEGKHKKTIVTTDLFSLVIIYRELTIHIS